MVLVMVTVIGKVVARDWAQYPRDTCASYDSVVDEVLLHLASIRWRGGSATPLPTLLRNLFL